ncbi:MAG: hypothetical protein K5666_02320 [Bacilli bacterium]|nr:hypothetical protein [Bacilli bacterium]
MKKICAILLTIISLFAFNAYAIRISHYETTLDINSDIIDNKVEFHLGYRGEEAYATSLNIEYDSELLEFDTIQPGSGFNVEVDLKTISTYTKKLTLRFSSNYIINEVTYGTVIFKLKDNFTVGKTTQLKLYDIISTSDTGDRFRSKGYYLDLERETTDTVSGIRTDISEEADRKNFINSILPFIIIGIAALFLLMFIIILLPSSKHENRSKKIKAQVSAKNYPVPGVGDLPKFSQKKKRDIIEPEQQPINPFKDFEAKTTTNATSQQSPFGTGLSNENNVFQDNPTRTGQEGLININPLAFTDDDSDDDIDTL